MIDEAPLWLTGIMLFASMVVAYEAGLRLHARLRSRADAPGSESSDESYVLSGVFGLLALLMAFSFSLALDRYEERRALVTNEANAIGTLGDRLALPPEADRSVFKSDLANYANARVIAGRTIDKARATAAFARAEVLHERFRERLYAKLSAGPMDARTTLLTQAFDATGDVVATRRAARAAQLPVPVLALLASYCVAGAAMLGYTIAGSRARHRLAAGLFFVLLTAAFIVIRDLDRPHGGAITVPQAELERVASLLSAGH